ncbi:hypothetical protein BJ875DRAFT_469898 [Amylocarpus encephaloides]|uniref:Uncharacterized protein n=1 Tax=Amylocarpus encephaloides TaxID=45428 RepID=A0A9P7YCD6_9HELO|nr:hypothetical protein BJ875DRAFT_469898 [Amylocarpus encephaloides]
MEHWKRQGIWNEEWGYIPGLTWKHEHAPRKSLGLDITKSEASRPIHQFHHQLFNELQDMVDLKDDGWKLNSPDINTHASEAVKKRWDSWGIWDTDWGSCPRWTWLHERDEGE